MRGRNTAPMAITASSNEDDFEAAFADALASGKPSVIDARITRWAIPHYSTSPRGTIAGIVEQLEQRAAEN